MKNTNLLRALAAVLLLTVFSCKKEDNVVPPADDPQPPEVISYKISFSATKGAIESKSLSPEVIDGRNVIISTWTKQDAVDVFKDGTRIGALSAQGDGASTTLSGDINKSVAAGDVLTLKYQSPSYSTQDGTLTGNPHSIDKVCDYSTATVTISGIEDNEVSIHEPEAVFESQQAIVKLTLLEDGEHSRDIEGLGSIIVEFGEERATVTPAAGIKNVFYVAAPALGETSLCVDAKMADGSGLYYTYGGRVTVEKSSYYELVLSMVARYYYDIPSQKTYANQDAFLSETGYDISSVQGYLSWIFPNRNTPVTAISYTYHSADPQGKPVDLSGVIYIPDAALSGTTPLTGIALTNHGTIASNAECPTNKAQLEGAMAWKNYAMIMPDYYGFGASSSRPQAYLDAATTARGNIDACLAAFQILKDRGVTIPSKLYSFGYSQGGFNSMANLKYVSEHPEVGITFEKVMCGGSPFDVELTWNAYTQGTFRNVIGFVPLTVVSINETQGLGLDYATLFKGSLLNNWNSWILSKQYTLSEINSKLGTNNLSDILNEDFMAGRNDSYNAVMNVCQRYSLTSGWTPPSSGTKIILCHSTQDDTVPFDNITAMKTFLDSTAPGSYSTLEGDYGGHFNAAISFIMNTISEW